MNFSIFIKPLNVLAQHQHNLKRIYLKIIFYVHARASR